MLAIAKFSCRRKHNMLNTGSQDSVIFLEWNTELWILKLSNPTPDAQPNIDVRVQAAWIWYPWFSSKQILTTTLGARLSQDCIERMLVMYVLYNLSKPHRDQPDKLTKPPPCKWENKLTKPSLCKSARQAHKTLKQISKASSQNPLSKSARQAQQTPPKQVTRQAHTPPLSDPNQQDKLTKP